MCASTFFMFTFIRTSFSSTELSSDLLCLSFVVTSECFPTEQVGISEMTGMNLKEVVTRLNTFAPLSLAASWDNVGLLLEPSGRRIPHFSSIRVLRFLSNTTKSVSSGIKYRMVKEKRKNWDR
jgi:hypothetical protein